MRVAGVFLAGLHVVAHGILVGDFAVEDVVEEFPAAFCVAVERAGIVRVAVGPGRIGEVDVQGEYLGLSGEIVLELAFEIAPPVAVEVQAQETVESAPVAGVDHVIDMLFSEVVRKIARGIGREVGHAHEFELCPDGDAVCAVFGFPGEIVALRGIIEDGIEHGDVRHAPGVVLHEDGSEAFVDASVSDEVQVFDVEIAGIRIVGDAVVLRGLLRRAESDQRAGERDAGLELGDEVVEGVEIALFLLHAQDLLHELLHVQGAVPVVELCLFRELRVFLRGERLREVGEEFRRVRVRVVQDAFREERVGDQRAGRAHQVQLADQVQGMLLPFGGSERCGVHAVLRLHLAPDHGLDVEQQQDGDDDEDERDDRQDEHLAVLAPSASQCRQVPFHAPSLQKCRGMVRELSLT